MAATKKDKTPKYDSDSLDGVLLLTTDDLARVLRLSPHTVTALRRDGEPLFADKAVKVRGSLRWRRKDVEEYVENLEYAS